MIKTVGYPIYVDMVNENETYYVNELATGAAGRTYFVGKSVDRVFDIAPLLREILLNAERVIIDRPAGDGLANASVQYSAGIIAASALNNGYIWVVSGNDLTLEDMTGDGADILIAEDEIGENYILAANDYNTDLITNRQDPYYFTSVFIRGEVDPRQICFFGANHQGKSSTRKITIQLNNGKTSKVISTGNPSVIIRSTIDEGATVFNAIILQSFTDFKIQRVNVLACQMSRYALYAVNRLGGITHIVMEGKQTQTNSSTMSDIQTHYNRLAETGRGIRRLAVTSTRKWRLSTGYLTREEAQQFEDIMTSPRLVLHDLEADRLFAVNMDTTSIDIPDRPTRPLEYVVTVSEARTEIRR